MSLITWRCQFAGVVTEVADTDVDSLSHQQADMAADSRQDVLTPQLQVGDQVLGACRFGSYTTRLNVSAQQVHSLLTLKLHTALGAAALHLLFGAPRT